MRGRFSANLPDIIFNGCEGIYFDVTFSKLFQKNPYYGPVPRKVAEVVTSPFSGDKGMNPICVMKKRTGSLVDDGDNKNLTLVYKLIERVL